MTNGLFGRCPYTNNAHVYHSANRKSLDRNYDPCYCVSQLLNQRNGERYPSCTYEDNLNHPKKYVKETNKKIKIKDCSTHCCSEVINQSVDACGVQSDYVTSGKSMCYDWNEIPKTLEFNLYSDKKHKCKDCCTSMTSKKFNKNTFDDMQDIKDNKGRNSYNYAQEERNIDESAIESSNRNIEIYTNNLESRSLGSTGTPVKPKNKSKLKFWVKKDKDHANFYKKNYAYFPENKDSFAATIENDVESHDAYCGNDTIIESKISTTKRKSRRQRQNKFYKDELDLGTIDGCICNSDISKIKEQPFTPIETTDMYSCKCCPLQNKQDDYLLGYRAPCCPMKTSQGTNNIYQEINKPASTYIENLGEQKTKLKTNKHKQKIRCSSACCPKEKIKRRNAINEHNHKKYLNCSLTCPKETDQKNIVCSDICCPKDNFIKIKYRKKNRCDSVCCPKEKVQQGKCRTISNDNERLDIPHMQEIRHDDNNNCMCQELRNPKKKVRVDKNMKSNFDCVCHNKNLDNTNKYFQDEIDKDNDVNYNKLNIGQIMNNNLDSNSLNNNLDNKNNLCPNCCANINEKNIKNYLNCSLTCCPKKPYQETNMVCSDKCCPKQKKKNKIRCDSACCPKEKVQREKCYPITNNNEYLDIPYSQKMRDNCSNTHINAVVHNPRKFLRANKIMNSNFDCECRDGISEWKEKMTVNEDCCNPMCTIKRKQTVENPFTDNRGQKSYGDNINQVSSENKMKFKKIGKRFSQIFGFKNKRNDKIHVDMAGGDINDKKIMKPPVLRNKKVRDIPNETQDKACLCANVTCQCAKEIKKLKERLKETKKMLKRKRRKEKFKRKRARELEKLNKKMEKRREKWGKNAEKRRLKRHLDSIKATRAAKVEELKMLSSNVHDPNTNFMKDVVGGIMKLGYVAITNTLSVFTKSVRDPKGTIRKVNRAVRNPSNTFADMKSSMDDPYSTWSLTKRKIRKSMTASQHMNVISDEFQNTAIYNLFASKAKTEQEIKNRQMNAKMRKKRIRKRNDDAIYGCRHILLTTLRKTPCLWIYHLCPAVYPQFVSVLMFWKNFFNILLMLLAVIVWTPCIAFFECFRAILCCFFC